MVEPDGIIVESADVYPPADGEVLVEMEASGVSYAEQQMRLGRYYDQPHFPFVPGYDLIGTVVAGGSGADADMLGRRVAAITKVGAWSTHLNVGVADLVVVPVGVDAAEAETVVVNGVTAWQMLHRTARVRAGQTILVHGANGGVGSTLVQLAGAAGIKVIGTASPRHHEALRRLGAEPVDYNSSDLSSDIRGLAPHGVDAVFDHLGGDGIVDSWHLLSRGGTFVSYGTAATKNEDGSSKTPILKLLARLAMWNLLPNRRHAHFYNLWAGKKYRPAAFRRRMRDDLGEVFDLLALGELQPLIAARFPIADAAQAMRLAESRTVFGKVVLIP